jgi:hypothetical protein
MSQAEVEMIRRGFEAFSRGDGKIVRVESFDDVPSATEAARPRAE